MLSTVHALTQHDRVSTKWSTHVVKFVIFATYLESKSWFWYTVLVRNHELVAIYFPVKNHVCGVRVCAHACLSLCVYMSVFVPSITSVVRLTRSRPVMTAARACAGICHKIASAAPPLKLRYSVTTCRGVAFSYHRCVFGVRACQRLMALGASSTAWRWSMVARSVRAGCVTELCGEMRAGRPPVRGIVARRRPQARRHSYVRVDSRGASARARRG